jgi:hypothetical protein
MRCGAGAQPDDCLASLRAARRRRRRLPRRGQQPRSAASSTAGRPSGCTASRTTGQECWLLPLDPESSMSSGRNPDEPGQTGRDLRGMSDQPSRHPDGRTTATTDRLSAARVQVVTVREDAPGAGLGSRAGLARGCGHRAETAPSPGRRELRPTWASRTIAVPPRSLGSTARTSPTPASPNRRDSHQRSSDRGRFRWTVALMRRCGWL